MSDNNRKSYRWQARIPGRLGVAATIGYLSIAAFGGGFGVWAATAPISGAVIASGVVAAAGENVMIQQKDGGIIQQIDVEEGDRVERGDRLFSIDDTAARTKLNRLVQQYVTQMATAARLEAVRDGLENMEMPERLRRFINDNPGYGDDFQQQKREFQAGLARYNTERKILRQRIATIEATLEGLKAQKTAFENQIRIVKDETERKRGLLAKGLTNRAEYSQLLRTSASLVGQAGEIQAQIASSTLRLGEAEQQMERLTTRRIEDAVDKLNEVRGKILDLEQQIRAARAVVERTAVTSPVDGIIVRSRHRVPGAVIGPGENVMELLPVSDSLIVEARVDPVDIDNVGLGQAVELNFSAFNARTTPNVDGEVFYVSADRLEDPEGRAPYYLVRLKITEELPSKVDDSSIYPGMPVTCFFYTEKRTFLQYFFQPLLDSFDRAFREE